MLSKFQVTVGEQLDLGFNMRVAHPKLQSPDDAEVHFNLLFNETCACRRRCTACWGRRTATPLRSS